MNQPDSGQRASHPGSLSGPFAMGASLLGALAVRYWAFTVDDAYISLRYARHLLAGQGLVFNPGERVEGFTSLTWTLLSAALLPWTSQPLVALKLLGLACALLTLWVSLLILRHLVPHRPDLLWLTAFLIAGAPCLVAWSVGGLETMLFALLLTTTFYAYLTDQGVRGWPTWPLWALVATLTRPEAPLIVPVLVAHSMLFGSPRARVRVLRALAVFLSLLAGFLAWRFMYYGSLLPNTYYAKVAGGGLPAALGGARYLFEFARCYGGPVGAALVAGVLLGANRPRGAGLLLVTVAAFFLTPLALGSDWMPQFRYLAPYWALAAVLVALGLERVGDLLARQGPGVRGRFAQQTIMVLVVVAFALSYGYQVILADDPGGPRYGHYGVEVMYHAAAVENYIRAGRRLAELARPGDTLAAFAIGAVGYYSDLRIIDAVGLTDKTIARLDPAQRLTHILSLRPTYIEDVSGEATTSGLTALPEFPAHYVPLGFQGLDACLYVCRDRAH